MKDSKGGVVQEVDRERVRTCSCHPHTHIVLPVIFYQLI